MLFLGKIEFLSPCPLAHFFFSILYNFHIFLSQLNRNKSGKVGRKSANPVKSRLCGCPLLFSKVGTKWASGQKISYSLPFSLKISWQFSYFLPSENVLPTFFAFKSGQNFIHFSDCSSRFRRLSGSSAPARITPISGRINSRAQAYAATTVRSATASTNREAIRRTTGQKDRKRIPLIPARILILTFFPIQAVRCAKPIRISILQLFNVHLSHLIKIIADRVC